MQRIEVSTRGHYDFINITEQVAQAVEQSRVKDGAALVFVPGTTAAVTLMEDEAGIKQDLRKLWETWAPEAADYQHHKKWGDHNGAAHMKSAIIGTDCWVPIADGRLLLGQWQSIVLIDFDERPRTRSVTVTILPAWKPVRLEVPVPTLPNSLEKP